MPRILAGVLVHFVDGLGDFHAAALAATARVDLRLDDPDLAAQGFSCLDRVVHGRAVDTARNRNAELLQDLLALIFVNFHGCPSIEVLAFAGRSRLVDGTHSGPALHPATRTPFSLVRRTHRSSSSLTGPTGPRCVKNHPFLPAPCLDVALCRIVDSIII